MSKTLTPFLSSISRALALALVAVESEEKFIAQFTTASLRSRDIRTHVYVHGGRQHRAATSTAAGTCYLPPRLSEYNFALELQ
jgi:hypothetical protein